MDTDKPSGTYWTIRIREKLAPRWEEWFNGMRLTVDDEGTQLSGYLPDQSALHGTIATIHRLGLRLLTVAAGDPDEGNPSGGATRADESREGAGDGDQE